MEREVIPERMDEISSYNSTLEGALNALKRSHQLLRSFRQFFSEIEQLIQLKGSPLSVLDVGGATGFLGSILKSRYGNQVRYMLMDRDQKYISHACTDEVIPLIAEAPDLPFSQNTVDVVTSFLFLHHLPEEDLIPFLGHSKQLACELSFHHDLLRDPLHYGLAYLFTRLTGLNSIYKTDALRSIKRSLKPTEWRQLLRYPEMDGYQLNRQWPYRINVIHRHGRSND